MIEYEKNIVLELAEIISLARIKNSHCPEKCKKEHQCYDCPMYDIITGLCIEDIAKRLLEKDEYKNEH